MKSLRSLTRALLLSMALGSLAIGCVLDGLPTPGAPGGPTGDDPPVAADPGIPSNPPQADPCDVEADMDLGVQIHTLLVNGSPHGFFVEGNFNGSASGPDGITVDIEFKPAGGAWMAVATGLPEVDVTTLDLSQYAGPASAWHFRGAVWAPACDEPVAYSSITTIHN